MGKQLFFNFVTRPTELGTGSERYYVVFLKVETRRPDPDEEYGGGFSTQYITETYKHPLCVIKEKAGSHVLFAAMKRYTEKYQNDPELLRPLVPRNVEITGVSVDAYTENVVEVIEITE